MKFFKKISSVLLSLVLCGSMVAPAFAATFTDLNSAIQDNNTEKKTYGEDEGITAWTPGTGDSSVRHVELNKDVTRDPDAAPSDAGGMDGSGMPISIAGTVDLDIGNHTIDGNGLGGIFAVSGELTVEAEEGGTLKGGSATEGGAVRVNDGGSFEMTGGTITGNEAAGFNDPDHPEYGSWEGNGGAIYAEKGSKATLKDTVVMGNTADDNGDGIYAEAGAEVELTGTAKVSGNGKEDVYLEYDEEERTGAQLIAPDTVTWIENETENTFQGGVDSGSINDPHSLSLRWTDPDPTDPDSGDPTNPDSGDPDDPTEPTESGESGDAPNEVEIADPDVPMIQGPVSCAEFIHKMWVLDGEPEPLDDLGLPEGLDEDHEYASAIAWAASAGIVSRDSFDAEALLTVALAREFLTGYAAYADMAMPELTTLTGKDSDLVMNSDDVLDEFFGGKDSE